MTGVQTCALPISAAVPVLLKKIQARDPVWKRALYRSPLRPHLPFRWMSAVAYERTAGHYGFKILGTQAVAAIPELSLMLTNPWTAPGAADALGAIGADGVTVLKNTLTNASSMTALCASFALARNEADLHDVWPQIMENHRSLSYPNTVATTHLILSRPTYPGSRAVAEAGLTNASPQIQNATLAGLVFWETNARPLIPLIIPYLTNQDFSIKDLAARVLRRADPEAARAHGVGTSP